MIIFQKVSKTLRVHGETTEILADVSVNIPTDRRIAFLKPAEHERQTFINLLAGSLLPTTGRIIRKASVSFPVGYLGGFSAELSVRDNVVHVARLYGANEQEVISFIERVGNFGQTFGKPYCDLPGPMKHQLGIIVALSIPFDVYLLNHEFDRIKGATKEFLPIASALVSARAQTSGVVVATDDVAFARQHCNMALILHNKRLLLFQEVEQAISALKKLLSRER